MKKLLFCFLLMFNAFLYGQQSLTDKINTLITNGGCGVANISISYSSANYWSRESVLVLKDSASSSTTTAHISFSDSNKVKKDTLFILNTTQLNNLLDFYQSVSNNSNPNPSLSAQHTGQASLRITMGCDDHQDATYISTLHISAYRTIFGDWTNWYQ